MKKILFFLGMVVAFTTNLMAQTRVTGIVMEKSDHEPLVGATVHAKGTNVATATDADGKFQITVPAGVKKLAFSYVGMRTIELDVEPQMTVEMEPTNDNLDEVVVVAYGTASKESLTGSVAVVNEKQISQRPVTSVTTALEGMAPGVQVNGSTGTPGDSPSILIRGINSVNGTTAPLYVVDGVVWNGNYNDINPNDVESISVLKDAASCALYGAKGANGVVLITTKKAKGAGKVQITAKIRQGIYQRALPEYERLGYNEWNEAYLQALTYGRMVNSDLTYQEALQKSIATFFTDAGVLNLYQPGEAFSESGTGVFDSNGKITMEKLPEFWDTNWWDAISRNGHRQEYNVSGTAATEKFNVFASVGYVKEKGYLLKTDFERFTARAVADFQPVKYLKFGVNVNGSQIASNQPQFDSSNLSSTSNAMSYQGTAPGLPYYEHVWKKDPNDPNQAPVGSIVYEPNGQPVWNTSDGYAAFTSNKGYILRANSSDYKRLALDGTAYATIFLPYNFEVTVRGTMNRYRQEDTEYDSPLIGSAKGFGRLTKDFYHRNTDNLQQYIYWSQEYGDNHIDVMLNHESYSRHYEYSEVANRDQLFPNNLYLSNFTENERTYAYAYNYKTETYMARARYNYNSQYFFEASISRDGSSKFAKDHRWGTFWSLGASWIINKEKFLQNVEQINNLKFRIAYGTAGNDYTSNYYPTFDLWSLNSNTLAGNPSVFPSTLGNKDIHWESTKTLDLALEGYFFNNRLNASVGFFSRVNKDLLYNVSQPPSNGTDGSGAALSQWQNIGNMRNTGWEIMVGGTILSTKDITWTAHVDATFIKNRLTKLPAGNIWSTRALIEGKSRYEYYLPIWAGTDMTTGRSLYEINKDSHQFETEVLNSDGMGTGVWQYDEEKWQSNLTNAENAGALVQIGDRYYSTSYSYASKHLVGTSLPTVYGSFGTAINWKGLSVSALFTYSLGGKTLNTVYAGMLSPSAGKSLHKNVVKDMWMPEMANGITDANRINPDVTPQINTIYGGDNNTSSTTRFLISNNYLAFKNLNVTYELQRKWIAPLKLKAVNIGVSIDNVVLATKMKGMNPTYNNAGGQGEYFVPSRVYSFELGVTF